MGLQPCIDHIELYAIILLIAPGPGYGTHIALMNTNTLENTDITLTCSNNGNQLGNLKWTQTTPQIIGSMVIKDGICTGSADFNDPSKYSLDCTDGTKYLLTLKKITQDMNGKIWRCGGFGSNPLSNEVTIFVIVPVKNSTITPYKKLLTVSENKKVSLQCTTSPCRPEPKFLWYKSNNEKDIILSQFVDVAASAPTIQTYTNSFDITMTRELNGWYLFCAAGNHDSSLVSSDKLLLNITYPPEEPPTISNMKNGSEVKVFQNDSVQLQCSVTGGNPLPRLEWNMFNDLPPSTHGSTITKNITWQANGRNPVEFKCLSYHPEKDESAFVKVNIMYPPDTPEINIKTASGNFIPVYSLLNVIKGRRFTLNCSAKSNPPVSSWKWSEVPSINNSIYVSSDDHLLAERLTCNVSNEMKTSDSRPSINGINFTTLVVNVLYPPKLEVLKDKIIIEGDRLDYMCNFTEGNPRVTTITWSWTGGSWNGTKLQITNASRNNRGMYRCTVQNFMSSSDEIQENGTDSVTFNLIVQYPPDTPEIKIKTASGHYLSQNETLTVIEGRSVTLNCSANSNPPVSLLKWNEEISINGSFVYVASCDRILAKTVTCYVSNNMSRSDTRQVVPGNNYVTLEVLVLYPPKIHPLKNKTIIEGDMFYDTCNFTEGNPSVTDITWSWKGGTVNGKQLQITNTSRNDSGIYKCTVQNVMTSSDKFQENGTDSGTFNLIVQYKTQVLKFIFNNLEAETLTVNDTDAVYALCEIEGNPSPTGQLLRQSFSYDLNSQDEIVPTNKTIRNSTNLILMHGFNAQCANTGIYKCRGTNTLHIGESASNRSISFFVNCSPRQSPSFDLKQNVTSALNSTATFHFITMAYPSPSFQWYRIENGHETTESHGGVIKISSISTSVMETKFTLEHVEKTQYGEYLLMISNQYGTFNQTFYLESEDKSIKPSSVGPAVGDPVGGNQMKIVIIVVVLVVVVCCGAVVIVVVVIRKRSLGKRTNAKGEDSNFEETHTYQNFSKEMDSNTSNPDGNALIIERKQTVLDSPLLPERLPLKLASQHNLQELDDYDDKAKERIYGNTEDMINKIERINVSELLPYITNKTTDFFGLEFQNIPKGLTKPYDFSQKPENIALNRYNGIYPYDHSRVKIADDPTFFINACYINGYKKKKAFIASLGPLSRTTYNFVTFWKMVWNERSDVIIMLTRLKEPSGVKCDQYWPETDKTQLYGEVTVASLGEEDYSDYVLRKFTVSKGNKERKLIQFHFMAWPDKSVPEDVTCVLEFRKRVHANHSVGPMIVHCSAGIGRTGTLIALEILIEEGEREGSVNVAECVKTMRDQRTSMVQTVDQYHYVYKALVNALVFDCESISFQKFPKYLEKTNTDQFNKMFQTFNQSVESDSTTESNARTVNKMQRDKNRIGCDIPGDAHRVRLFLNRYDETSTDYINAVYVDTFTKSEHFVVAQSPMTNGVEDFLCMIYQVECTCIVSLGDSRHGTNVGMFIPTDDTLSLAIGCFNVTCKVLDTKDNYIIRKVKIEFKGRYEGGEKVVYHFEYNDWALGQNTPNDPHKFVAFTQEVEEFSSQLGTGKSQVLVHCLNAFERSCLFCAVVTLVEKVKYEGEVCVPNVLRHIRARRKLAIPNMDQFQFCFKAVRAYISKDKTGSSVEEKAYINMALA